MYIESRIVSTVKHTRKPTKGIMNFAKLLITGMNTVLLYTIDSGRFRDKKFILYLSLWLASDQLKQSLY